jgi:hypothetical protein
MVIVDSEMNPGRRRTEKIIVVNAEGECVFKDLCI